MDFGKNVVLVHRDLRAAGHAIWLNDVIQTNNIIMRSPSHRHPAAHAAEAQGRKIHDSTASGALIMMQHDRFPNVRNVSCAR